MCKEKRISFAKNSFLHFLTIKAKKLKFLKIMPIYILQAKSIVRESKEKGKTEKWLWVSTYIQRI